jgi:hypothetical protein
LKPCLLLEEAAVAVALVHLTLAVVEVVDK